MEQPDYWSDFHNQLVAEIARALISPFPVPLRQGESEPIIQLQDLVNKLYEQLGYNYFIDYGQEPPTPWTHDEVVPWLGKLA